MSQQVYRVQGLRCGHCERAAVEALREVGVQVVEIAHATGRLVVEEGGRAPEALDEVVRHALAVEGYTLTASSSPAS